MARLETADLLLLPWSETGTLADEQNGLAIDTANRFSNGAYTDFIYNILLERVQGNVGIFIEHNPTNRLPAQTNHQWIEYSISLVPKCLRCSLSPDCLPLFRRRG